MQSLKKKLREALLAKRNSLSKKDIREKSQKIKKNLLKLPELKNAKNFSAYLNLKNEVETKEIIDELIKRKAKIFVPASSHKKHFFSSFENWENLEKESYSVLQPKKATPIEPQDIEIAIIPGVGFSRTGLRLGYGKGIFDKLLKESNALKIGLAYELQITNDIPEEEHDVKMDLVITEKNIYRTNQQIN